MLFDRIALESHSYVATKAERIRNSTHWMAREMGSEGRSKGGGGLARVPNLRVCKHFSVLPW